MDKINLIYLKASDQNQFGGAHYVCCLSAAWRLSEYTKYGVIWTSTVGRNEKLGPASGTLDINILGLSGTQVTFFSYNISSPQFIWVYMIKLLVFWHKTGRKNTFNESDKGFHVTYGYTYSMIINFSRIPACLEEHFRAFKRNHLYSQTGHS